MMQDIPVVILCGGLGTRMKEETEYIPKPLIEVGGIPLIVHIMNIYYRYGFSKFVLPLGYKGIKIKEYFLNYKYHNDFRILPGGNVELLEDRLNKFEISFIETGLKTLTGSRIKKIRKYLENPLDTFMLTYGDGVSDIDVNKLLEFHLSHGKAVTMTGVYHPPRYGTITHDDNLITSFEEKSRSGPGLVNGGFLVFNKRFIDYIGDGDDVKLEAEPMSRAVAEKDVMVYEHSGRWACGDIIREIEDLNNMFNNGGAFWIK